MGAVIGKTKLAEPSFEVLKATDTYEIRKYKQLFVAEIPYANDPETARKALTRYVGICGFPRNKQGSSNDPSKLL